MFDQRNFVNNLCSFEKEVIVVHRGRYNNNKCIIVCLTMKSLWDVNRDVSTAYC